MKVCWSLALLEGCEPSPPWCPLVSDPEAHGANMFSSRSKTWTFPSLKGPGPPAEVYLAVEEEEEEPVAFSSFRAVSGASSGHTGGVALGERVRSCPWAGRLTLTALGWLSPCVAYSAQCGCVDEWVNVRKCLCSTLRGHWLEECYINAVR